MNDEQLRDAYARGLPEGRPRPPLDDLSAEHLRRLVEREGPDAERLHTIDTMLRTAEGRRELEIAWAAVRAARPRRSRVWRWGIGVAATVAAAAGIGTIWFSSKPTPDLLRDATSPIRLVAPLGTSPARAPFTWRPLENAERYQLVVVDTTGADVFVTETRDTTVSLPDTLRLTPGVSYLWWVQATTRDGASVTAVTQRIRIQR
jgi:hypothetical protein